MWIYTLTGWITSTVQDGGEWKGAVGELKGDSQGKVRMLEPKMSEPYRYV